MTWTEERITVNQHLQIGAESTQRTRHKRIRLAKELLCFEAVYQPKGDTVFYRGTGRKYPSEQEQNTEWMEATWGGVLDFNGLIYPLACDHGQCRTGSARRAIGNGKGLDILTTSHRLDCATAPTRWSKVTPPMRKRVPTISSLTLATPITRKDVKMTAKTISQVIQLGITLTITPTVVSLLPIPAKLFNIYLDTTSGGLGTTKLTKVLQLQFQMSTAYAPFWPINAANASYRQPYRHGTCNNGQALDGS